MHRGRSDEDVQRLVVVPFRIPLMPLGVLKVSNGIIDATWISRDLSRRHILDYTLQVQRY